ncbi:sensor histidine kinase [Acetivibrio ethanolgignens]|uniref:Sensor histidine kinase NatK-like C-terminal domain-containing protein n=1 Tax=Acetivibrio ethanolgignens TaxID=290052 RepID=A0A0V8QH14_9FIRM|nr:GHKL domain-containing protein [Acetivibrio ethanolgignens]KSV59710.1 hypothetical protein ASU35_08130 [Acetivibrio ethanolgignens]
MPEYELVHIVTNPIFTFAIYKLFHTFFKEDAYDKRIERLTYLLYFIVSSVLPFITKIPLVTLIFTISFFFGISFNYKSSLQKKIVVSSFVYAILFVIEIVMSVSIGFMDISALKDSTFHSGIGLILIRTVTMLTAYLLNRYKNARRKDFPIPSAYYAAFIIILFGTLYLFAISLEKDNLTLFNVLISGAVLILVNITMILIDEKIYNSIAVKNEKYMLEQQNIAYENQAEIMKQSNESIRALKHDMKNHLLMLSAMYKNGRGNEIEDYVGKILVEMTGEGFSSSNNFVIDSIVNFKLKQLYDTDTKIAVDVCVPPELNILAYDMTVILGNLLDNAITATLKAEDKRLDLRISCSMGNLIILIENSFDGELIFEDGRFKTTKKHKNKHGLGLSNIEKILEKYGGEIRMDYTGETFSTSVILPYEG